MFYRICWSINRWSYWRLFWSLLSFSILGGAIITSLADCTYHVDVNDPQVSVGTVQLCVVVDLSDAGQVVLICPDGGHE